MRLCTIDACSSKHYGKGFCFKHYYRQYKHGSPEIIKQGSRYPIFKTLKESFEAKFKKENNEKCWNWIASKSTLGYGSFTFKGKRYIAHRVSYMIYIGEIDKKMHVCHTCDNPACVNPAHLFAGSVKDNMKDMVYKNRSAKGQNHSQAKLNDKQVKEIKKLIKQGKKCKDIASIFGVQREAINKIQLGKRWSHIQ